MGIKQRKRLSVIEKRMLASCLFLLLTGGLPLCAFNISGFAEWYAGNIYPVWANTLGRLTGVFPFSIVEMGLYAAIAVVSVTGIRTIWKIVHEEKGGERMHAWSSGLFLFASVLLFMYIWNGGINYRRESFFGEGGIGCGNIYGGRVARNL